MHHDLTFLDFFRRTVARHTGVRLGADAPHTAHMPELRNDLAAFSVHGIDHFLPAGQRGLAIEMWNVGVAVGCLVTHRGALGDDQAHTGRRATAVVLDHF
ncbi:hypothetical protein D3C71_1798890 [compost metagenome]